VKFSYIDLFLYGGLLLAAYLGYRGGFTKKIFNLLALLGSIVIATQLMRPVGGALIGIGFGENIGYILGFALVVAAIMTLTISLYRRFGKISVVKSSSQMFGVILGVIEGCLIISLLLLALRVFDMPAKDTRTDSLLYKPLVNFAPKTLDLLRSYLPGASAFKDELTDTFKDIDIFEYMPKPGRGI